MLSALVLLPLPLALAQAAASAGAAAAATSTIATVSVPSSVPSANSSTIYPSYANLAIEWSRLIAYTQTSQTDTSPNQYSINLINNIFNRGTGHPIVRVGGTSDTGGGYQPSQASVQSPYPTSGVNPTSGFTYNSKWWSSVPQPWTSNLNPTVYWIPEVPLDTTSGAQNVVDTTIQGLSDAVIYAVELFNEPNCGSNSVACNVTYLANLMRSATTMVHNANSSLSILGPDWCGEGGATTSGCNAAFPAGGNANTWGPYSLQQLFSNYQGAQTLNFVNYASDHYYLCNNVPGGCGLSGLMNHKTIINNLGTVKSNAAFFNAKGIPYILNEVNVGNGQGTVEAQVLSLAASMAEVDFMLYAATIGVRQVHWESISSNQSTWIPQNTGGVPQATHQGYYALVAVNDFIKNSDHIAQITPSGNDGTYFSAYAVYSGNVVKSITLLNLNYWDSSQGSRPAPAVRLSGFPSSVTSATLKYLTATDGAPDYADTMSYGGNQWTAANVGKQSSYSTPYGTTTVSVSGGVASIVVPATAGVIISW